MLNVDMYAMHNCNMFFFQVNTKIHNKMVYITTHDLQCIGSAVINKVNTKIQNKTVYITTHDLQCIGCAVINIENNTLTLLEGYTPLVNQQICDNMYPNMVQLSKQGSG